MLCDIRKNKSGDSDGFVMARAEMTNNFDLKI